MAPDELKSVLKQHPFEPFRLVIYGMANITTPSPVPLFWVGQRVAYVGA